jgi:DNA-binding MarR family transcriptional regulator
VTCAASHHTQHPDLSSRPLPYQVLGAFHQLLHSNRQLMLKRFAEHGAHPGQTFCLRELARQDGMTQSELADRLQVARSTVTVMLQKMEKAGLIERRSDEQDQRFTRIYLTDAGRSLHAEMRRQLDEIITDLLDPIPEADQLEMLRLFTALNASMQSALGKTEGAHDHDETA